MTSSRLNETLSTGIFRCVKLFTPAMSVESDFVPVKLLSMSKNVKSID